MVYGIFSYEFCMCCKFEEFVNGCVYLFYLKVCLMYSLLILKLRFLNVCFVVFCVVVLFGW